MMTDACMYIPMDDQTEQNLWNIEASDWFSLVGYQTETTSESLAVFDILVFYPPRY